MIYPILSNFRQALLTDKKKGTKYVITNPELFNNVNNKRLLYTSIKDFKISEAFGSIENALYKYINENNISYDDGDLILITNNDFDIKYYFLCNKINNLPTTYGFYLLVYATFINEDYIIDRTLSGVDYKYLKTFERYKENDYHLAFDLYHRNIIEAYPKNALTKTASAEIIEDCLTNNLSIDYFGIQFHLSVNEETQFLEQSEEEIKNIVFERINSRNKVADIQKLNIGKYNNDTDVVVESSGNLISYVGYELCFLITYESVSYPSESDKALVFVSRKKNRDIIIRKSLTDDFTSVDYTAISNLNDLEYDQIKSIYTNLLNELESNNQKEEKQKAYDTAVKVVESNEQVIENKPQTTIEEIVAPVSNPIDKKEDSFWEEAEKILSEELTKEEEEKTTRKKKQTEKAKKENIEKISTTKDISEEEFVIASKETIYEPDIMVEMKIPNVSATDIGKSIKIKEEKYKSQAKITPDDYPADWNYIYSIKETSKMYNPTIFSDGEKGMTLEEWNAYFLAHPELGHLIEETIGDFGGIIYSEKDLMDMGLLLYNPETQKIQYKYDYLTGNTYTLLENFESAYQQVVDTYGEDFFEIQKQAIISATPQPKSYDSTEIEKQPYIHPLDEVVIDFKINAAADVTFPVNINSKLVSAIKKVYGKDTAKIEEELSGIQSLSIVNFFKQWLYSQTGKLGNYGLKDIVLVVDGYFESLSYTGYLNYLEELGYKTQINPQTQLPFDIKEEITESDFFEVKESIKSFVNDLFQDFVRDIISIDDKNNLLYAWNKKYNGFAKIDIYKFPVFIRHAKYIKDRTKKIEFVLSDTQIEGIKFATINNSSIIAHEVGFGKTLTSIGFMSHIFETNQANNIMVLVPKSLYANKKWKEEISGNIDVARNRTILGAIPQYNLIEMNNFSTTYVFNDGEEGGPKTYTDDEIRTIRSFYQYITEIGGTIKGRKLRSNPTAKGLLPNNINYSRSVTYWTKVINDLKNTDLNLFNRSIGRNGELQQLLLSILTSNTGSKSQNDILNVFTNLYETIFIKTEFEFYYPGITFDRNNPPREFMSFLESELSAYKYKKDKDGKVARDKDGKKIEIPQNKLAEAYILGKLEEIHYWLNTTLQKMSDFAIYEYGTWNFPIGKKNIILATRDSLENLGFSSNSREDIIKVIKEITEYKYEQTTDIDKDITYTYVDNQGVSQVFTRKPQTVLSRQLEDLIGKIENYMTEEGDYGKFFLNNLGIDGFILDEAHLAKKIFTNVKTDKRMEFELPTGKFASMVVSSHDIKGGATPPRALRVFGVSQYIRSLGDKKPLMLLTATPFSNQPTEIFSMLSIVGIKQLRQQGISNIKNFFDLFLKESLKYDFDHKGNFIKRITVEDFRNKELLANVIWSVIDIKREASIKDSEDKKNKKGAKPNKFVLPKLSSDASIEDVDTGSSEDKELDKQLKDLTSVSTVAVINRMSTNTCSIVDRNDIQTKMMKDIESVITDEINPKTGIPYSFKDICPNFELIAEIEEEEQEEDDKKRKKKKVEDKKKAATEAIAKDNSEYGKVFKAMGMSRSLCLSPYFFNCNDLPYPTPENIVKYSPKIEYLVKAIENVKNYHIRKNQEISGQLAYFNMIRFKYYYKKDGKAVVETFNILELIKEYLVNKGVFKANEIAIFSSDTSDDKKEDYIKGFQDGNIKLFFGTPAMREGVDLQHKGSTLYVMTPDWNPTDMRQIEGRIWRRDNEYKWVRIIYVLLDQSIEVFIYAKLEEKARRLQQIMKERNSIEELQEMSLNPYQTKIALTTEPEKRADIITKLSEIVWIEKKNKLSQAKTAIQQSEDNMNEVKTAIDIAYRKYFKPFNEKFPAISQAVTDYKIKQIAEDKIKSPVKFINKYFSSSVGNFTDSSNSISDLPISEITKYHAIQVYLMDYSSFDMEIISKSDISYLYTLPGEGAFPLLDYFRIIKLFAENHNNQEYKDFLNLPSISERINFIMNKYPLWLSPLLSSHGTIATKIASDFYSVGGFSTGINVLSRITQEERDIVIQICNKVESSFGQGAKSRNEIISEIIPLVELLNEEVYKSSETGGLLDEITISMTPKYKDVMSNKFNPISEQTFMSYKFLEKINSLSKLQSSIEDYERNLYSLPKDTREKILSKTNKYPTYLDILPQLRLGKDPKQTNDLDTILAPVSKFRSTLRDTYEEFLKPNNLDFDDIDYLSRKVQREYSDIEDKLKQIQKLKVKLIERYKKVNQERKNITIDDVITQFGLTNSFLDEKLDD